MTPTALRERLHILLDVLDRNKGRQGRLRSRIEADTNELEDLDKISMVLEEQITLIQTEIATIEAVARDHPNPL